MFLTITPETAFCLYKSNVSFAHKHTTKIPVLNIYVTNEREKLGTAELFITSQYYPKI